MRQLYDKRRARLRFTMPIFIPARPYIDDLPKQLLRAIAGGGMADIPLGRPTIPRLQNLDRELAELIGGHRH